MLTVNVVLTSVYYFVIKTTGTAYEQWQLDR